MAVIPEHQHLLEQARVTARKPRLAKEKTKNERNIDAMVAKNGAVKLNGWEERFAQWIAGELVRRNLTVGSHWGERDVIRVCGWGAQRISLRLPGGSWYRPDFDVDAYDPILDVRRTRFVEVKGFLREKARLKVEEAAAAYPQFDFYIAYKSMDGPTGTCPFRLARIERKRP